MSFVWRRKKPRKYPLKKDEYGRSARRRAFYAFDSGKRPSEVARQVRISFETACRYFADWKKLPKNWRLRYDLAKRVLKGETGMSKRVIALLADHLCISEEEVMERIQKPWGIKQLLTDQWPNYRREQVYGKQEARLRAALELVRFVESSGMSPEDIKKLIEILVTRASDSESSEPVN